MPSSSVCLDHATARHEVEIRDTDYTAKHIDCHSIGRKWRMSPYSLHNRIGDKILQLFRLARYALSFMFLLFMAL